MRLFNETPDRKKVLLTVPETGHKTVKSMKKNINRTNAFTSNNETCRNNMSTRNWKWWGIELDDSKDKNHSSYNKILNTML
jgi:hypothetical protein